MSRGCLRYNARRDVTERAIVRDLLKCGASVDKLPGGKGRPDLLVGYQGDNHLLEVKDEDGELQQDQIDWACEWRGRKPRLVRCTEEALRAIGAIK